MYFPLCTGMNRCLRGKITGLKKISPSGTHCLQIGGRMERISQDIFVLRYQSLDCTDRGYLLDEVATGEIIVISNRNRRMTYDEVLLIVKRC